ncbi:MAG: hypothetical protein IJD10_04845 [Clostridia bacterium]|nr:hypothetical protein [Clostridia bacterium]
MITYRVIEDHDSEGSYGIAACDSELCEDEQAITLVRDVTCDRSALEDLAETCSRLQLSPIHLHEVVEDFLIG